MKHSAEALHLKSSWCYEMRGLVAVEIHRNHDTLPIFFRQPMLVW